MKSFLQFLNETRTVYRSWVQEPDLIDWASETDINDSVSNKFSDNKTLVGTGESMPANKTLVGTGESMVGNRTLVGSELPKLNKIKSPQTPKVTGKLGAGLVGGAVGAALGFASGAKAEDIASGLMDPISTPFDRSAGLGSDKLDTDTDKYYDKQGRPKRSAWPANSTNPQGKPITNWSPEK